MGEAKASMAEQLADDDAGVCSEPFCYKPAAVIVGPDATELCTEHAADLVQQLMALPKVRAALEARSREGK